MRGAIAIPPLPQYAFMAFEAQEQLHLYLYGGGNGGIFFLSSIVSGSHTASYPRGNGSKAAGA
jgi:hypothetical protein